MKLYRQGDVLIQSIDEIPTMAKKSKSENGKVILAYGEVTGHHHRFEGNTAVEYRSNAERFISTKENAKLFHEEHETITFPRGNYKIIQQNEYTPQEIKRVVD
jgi:hypothetical protein